MSRDYDTAPAVAMGLGPEFAMDNQLAVDFYRKPVLDELLSYGWRPEDVDKFTIPENHPRRKELEALGRIEGPDLESTKQRMLIVSKSDEPHYKDVEFIRIIRRGEDPADVMSNLPELPLCEHPVGRPCPALRSCYKNRFAERYSRWKAGQDVDSLDGLPLSEVPFIEQSRRLELAHRNIRTAEQLLELSADVASKIPGIVALQERVRRFLAATKGAIEEEKLSKKLAERDERIAALEKRLAEMDVASAAKVPEAPQRVQPPTRR